MVEEEGKSMAGFKNKIEISAIKVDVFFSKIILLLIVVCIFPVYSIYKVNAQDRINLLEDERYFKDALIREPSNPDIHYDLGKVYLYLNKFSEAIEEFKQVVYLNPEDAEAFMELGILFYQQNRLKIAESYFNKSIALNSKNSYSWYRLAMVQTDLCRSEEAIESLKKSLELTSEKEHKTKILFYIGTLQLNLRKKIEALKTADDIATFSLSLAEQLRELAAMN